MARDALHCERNHLDFVSGLWIIQRGITSIPSPPMKPPLLLPFQFNRFNQNSSFNESGTGENVLLFFFDCSIDYLFCFRIRRGRSNSRNNSNNSNKNSISWISVMDYCSPNSMRFSLVSLPMSWFEVFHLEIRKRSITPTFPEANGVLIVGFVCVFLIVSTPIRTDHRHLTPRVECVLQHSIKLSTRQFKSIVRINPAQSIRLANNLSFKSSNCNFFSFHFVVVVAVVEFTGISSIEK